MKSNTNPLPIFDTLRTLHAPFGPTCPSLYNSLLESWGDSPLNHGQTIIDWDSTHPTIDPLALLDNPELSGSKKHNIDVFSQTQLISNHITKLNTDEDISTPKKRKKATRGQMKRWQVESIYLVLRHLCRPGSRRMRVVDFGCGSGSLLLPLASLFPNHDFIGVDMKVTSLAILRQRAEFVGLSNIETFVGRIEEFNEAFDVALALHACGNASDMAILKAIRSQASFILAPCCIGKLKFSLVGGSSFNLSASVASYEMPKMKEEMEMKRVGEALMAAASGQKLKVNGEDESSSPFQNKQVIHLRHPRSKALREALGEENAEAEFKRIARVADTNADDISNRSDSEAERIDRLLCALDDKASDKQASFYDKCQIAKIHIELDRLLAAAEEGYRVGLYRLIQAGSQAKGDLLVGIGPNEKDIEGRRLMML